MLAILKQSQPTRGGAAANFSELWHASTTNWRRRASAKHSRPLSDVGRAMRSAWLNSKGLISRPAYGLQQPSSGGEKVLSRIVTPFTSSTKEMNLIKATSLALASTMLISNAASA